jgi:hypothetical protein
MKELRTWICPLRMRVSVESALLLVLRTVTVAGAFAEIHVPAFCVLFLGLFNCRRGPCRSGQSFPSTIVGCTNCARFTCHAFHSRSLQHAIPIHKNALTMLSLRIKATTEKRSHDFLFFEALRATARRKQSKRWSIQQRETIRIRSIQKQRRCFSKMHALSSAICRSAQIQHDMRQARNSMIKKDMKSSHGEVCVSNVRKLVVGRRSRIEGTIQIIKVAGTDAPATSVHRST